MTALKQRVKKIRPLLVGYIIGRSLWARRRFAAGKIDSYGGALTVHLPLETSLAYINRVFDDFLTYGPLSPGDIAGKRIIELGPGDNVGCALRFAALGARQVICMDKFFTIHDSERERQIYLALRAQLSEAEKKNFDQAIDLSGVIRFNEERLRYIYGTGGEDADTLFPENSFDMILSRGVLQGLDMEKCIAAIARLLVPGGLTLHKSDLRDHGMFGSNGYHPLEFLTLSDSIYKLMTEGTDRPNRRHIHHYRAALQKSGLEAKLYRSGIITRVYKPIPRDIVPHKLTFTPGVDYTDADAQMVREIRPRLRPDYQSLSDEDLLTAGIFISARKPAAG